MTAIDIINAIPDLNNADGTKVPEQEKRPLLTRIGSTHDFLLRLDNTTASIFQTCPRAAKFYTIHRKQRPGRAPLVFGGAIHAALEVLYRDGFTAEKKALTALLDYIDKNPYSTTGEWRTPAYAIEAVQRYIAYWSLMDNLTPISPDWVEKAFALNIGTFEIKASLPYPTNQVTEEGSNEPLYIDTLHVQYTGKLDIGATNGDPNEIFVVDHKTSSMGGATFFDDFELSQQTHGYQWAMQKILGRPVQGFILNALLIRKPTRTGTGMEFDRKSYCYSQESILEWEQDMLQSVESYVNSLVHDTFPKYTAWCMGKYGKCQYHDVCTLPSAQRRFMLHSDFFTNVTWSPLEDK